MAVTRNAGATYFIPSEDEWYKAAYYDPTLNGGAGGYWAYPTGSNSAPSNVLSAIGTNNANFITGTFPNITFTDPTNYSTPVGCFADSPGPYWTYDMGGDIDQWNETGISGSWRGLRGGSWDGYSDYMAADYRNAGLPTVEVDYVGFRVASVPEPGSLALLLAGGPCLAASWRKRRRLCLSLGT